MTRPLTVAVVDLVTKAPNPGLYGRVMNANYAGVMPQIVALWCEQEGHEVSYICYTGVEDLSNQLPDEVDLLFVTAFSQSAMLAYALSNLYRSKGSVTALGGPHARSYPQDAQKYFDYVFGFTDRELVVDLLRDPAPQRAHGTYLAKPAQPSSLPGVRERWKFIKPTIAKAPLMGIVPMLGSLGCPYTCDFCIDASVPYQAMPAEQLTEDIAFLRKQMPRPRISWYDPNFGVRFDEALDAIEAAAPPGSVDFLAESSLSLLGESHLKRLRHNGFKVILPGIESWHDMGFKANTGTVQGMDKVHQVAEHVRLIQSHIPYVQANFVLGLDADSGDEPFELTKRFIDLAPAMFPGFSLLTAFGQASPLNLDFQRDGRLLPFPFHFLNNNHAMNVRPKHYSWPEFYDRIIDLTQYAFSAPRIYARFRAAGSWLPRWMNVLRAISSEGSGRLRYYREIRARLDNDPELIAYFAQESTTLPEFFHARIRRDLGDYYRWLPPGAIEHDPYAALRESDASLTQPA